MLHKPTLIVHARWDDDAQVWSAWSDDVPGLVTEAESMDKLTDKLRALVPELIELNGLPDAEPEVPLELLVQSEHRLTIGC